MATKSPYRLTAKTTGTWPLMARLGREYLLSFKGQLGWAVVAMLIVAGALSLQAHLIQPLFDNGLIDRKIGVMNTVIFTLLALTLIRGIATYYQANFMEGIGQRLIAQLQEDMYRNTLRQSLGFFAAHPSGTLTSRFVADLHRLKYACTQIFNGGLRDIATIIGLFANMLVQDWRLTLITLAILPLTILPIKRFGKLIRKYSKTNQEHTALLSHHLQQTLQHVRQVQSFTAETFEQHRTHRLIQEVLATTLKSVRVRALSSPVVELIGTVAMAFILLYASRRIADGTLTPGAFASFMASLVMMSRPLKGITNLNNNLQEGMAAAERAFELIDTPSLLTDVTDAKKLALRKGEIVFDDVTLTYPDGTVALHNLSLSIPAGHTVAFVGPSGAGKSSLLNMVPRFYQPSGGSITIDGQDIARATLASLRENIALVSQDVAIFDDTIAHNIAYGAPKTKPADIEKAARAAAAHDFIIEQPQGYQTMLGENGVKLSGGQKQRLAIARAILKDAPILLLDEATASLDTRSELAIQEALKSLSDNRTTMIVAHRLSTITHANTIYVMENGRIVEQGTHRSLLAKKGLYAKLWSLQSGV
jgi:ATP-binding cassette, subfamily B, bacterial MsbA